MSSTTSTKVVQDLVNKRVNQILENLGFNIIQQMMQNMQAESDIFERFFGPPPELDWFRLAMISCLMCGGGYEASELEFVLRCNVCGFEIGVHDLNQLNRETYQMMREHIIKMRGER